MNCNTEAGRAAFFRVVEHHPKLFQRLRKQVGEQCIMGQYGKKKISEDQLPAQLISTFALGCLEVVGEDFDNLKKFITDEAALLAGNLRKPSSAPGIFLSGVVWGKIERPKDQIALQKRQESEGEAALDVLIRSPQKEALHKAATEALLALNRCYKKKEEESEDFWRSSRQRISQGLTTNALRDQEWNSFLQKVRNEHVAILSSFTTSLFSEKSTQACVDAYIKGKLLSDYAYSTEIYLWHAPSIFLEGRIKMFYYDLAKRIDPESILHSSPGLQITTQEIAFREIFVSIGGTIVWECAECAHHSRPRQTFYSEARNLVTLLQKGFTPKQFEKHHWDFQKHEFVPGAKEAQELSEHRRRARCDGTIHALSNLVKTVFPGDELAVNIYFADVFLKEWNYSPEQYIQKGDDLSARIKKKFSSYDFSFPNP